MTDIEKANQLLSTTKNTFIACKGDSLYTSEESGLKPIITLINQGVDLKGFSVADKIIGKAAALLFLYSGIKEVCSPVMSKGAIDLFISNGIEYSTQIITEKIINRAGDDICPMEKAVENISCPEQAYKAIINTIDLLRRKSE